MTIIYSTTILYTVVPSAPGPVVTTFSNSGPPSSFTVSWSPPSSPVVGGISGYMFGVTGDCGDCMNITVSADTLSVTCSRWTANDQTCAFEVRTLTQDCGFLSDAATNSITLSSEYCIGDNNYIVLVKCSGLLWGIGLGVCMYILYAIVITKRTSTQSTLGVYPETMY